MEEFPGQQGQELPGGAPGAVVLHGVLAPLSGFLAARRLLVGGSEEPHGRVKVLGSLGFGEVGLDELSGLPAEE